MERIAQGTEPAKEDRPRPGEPRPPSFQGVLVRALVIALLYGAFLAFAMRERPLVAAVVALFGFALMIPLGLLLDRFRYRAQMKRWRAQNGIPEPVKVPRAKDVPAAGDDA